MEFNDIVINIKKKRKILFDWNSKCLLDLINIFESKSQQEIISFIFPLLKEEIVSLNEFKPNFLYQQAYNEALAYLNGEIKLPIVKQGILAIHALAKEEKSPILVAKYHALAQGLSTIHVKEHAMSFIFYDLTAFVLTNGLDTSKLEEIIKKLENKLKVNKAL